MTERAQPTDLELAALISSKICHDVIGPVGAIYNGLEILDEDDDAEAKNYALDVIRNVTSKPPPGCSSPASPSARPGPPAHRSILAPPSR